MPFPEWIAALAGSLAMTRGPFRSGLPRVRHCNRPCSLSLRAEGEAIQAFSRMDCRARRLARNDEGAVPLWIAARPSLQPSMPPVIADMHPSLRAEGEANQAFSRMD